MGHGSSIEKIPKDAAKGNQSKGGSQAVSPQVSMTTTNDKVNESNPLSEAVQPSKPGETRTFASVSDIFDVEGSTARYIKKQSIGKGAYGEAYVVERNVNYKASEHQSAEAQFANNKLAHDTIPGGSYVAKIMDLRGMLPQDRQYAQTEIMCLAHSNHFAIIRYYEHYVLDSEDETMVIITEFADHSDLYRNLNRGRVSAAGTQRACLHLSEREAGTYFVQLLLAIHHVHSRRMIHRDIKSANLFLTSRGFLKLGDFGFSQKYESTVSSETVAGTFLGTPYYLSPEMWGGMRYGKKADIWAAGVVLYEMLMDGDRPFEASSLPELRKTVLEREVQLPEYPPDNIDAEEGSPEAQRPKFSPEIRELIQLIFKKKPTERPSTEELLHLPIMQHYLYLFEKHVQSLIDADNKLKAQKGFSRAALNFFDDSERDLVLQGIATAKETIAKEAKKEILDSTTPRCEGVVFKDNRNGVWKERYLTLADGMLTISLSSDKSAATGTSRSKKVPVKLIKAATPCEVEDAHVRATNTAADGEKASRASDGSPKYAFAISMQSSNSIVLGVATKEDLDMWLTALLNALEMD